VPRIRKLAALAESSICKLSAVLNLAQGQQNLYYSYVNNFGKKVSEHVVLLCSIN
jgi:hypothetical protein